MASKVFGKGTLLQAGDTSSATSFVTIPGCKEISFAGFGADVIDVTSHDTPGGFKDTKQGLKSWGTITTEMIWDPGHAMHEQIYSDMVAGTERYYQIVYTDTDSTTFQFKGWVKNGPPGKAPIDNVLTAPLEISIIGDPQPTLESA